MAEQEVQIGRPDQESEKVRKIESLQRQIESGLLKDNALLAAQRQVMELRGETPPENMEI